MLRLIILKTTLFLVCCPLFAQQPPAISNLFPAGLQEKAVTVLAAEARESWIGPHQLRPVFAGTVAEGVFQVTAFDSTFNWQPVGLDTLTITALTLQRWGIGPADGLRLYAAVQEDSVRIWQREFALSLDTVWVAGDSGLDRSNLQKINTLKSYYFSGHTPPQPILAGAENGLFQRPFFGKWIEAEVTGTVKINALDVWPPWYGDLAWAAGRSGLSPAAFRSRDKGTSWTVSLLPADIEGEAFAVAINPLRPDSVYVAGTNVVFMTSDSGATWDPVLQQAPVEFHALAVHPLTPEHIFAGGTTGQNQFAFYHSADEGVTWQSIQPDPSADIAGVTSIAVLIADQPEPNTYVYLGTNGTGVWLYRPDLVTEVGSDDDAVPRTIALHQNYPNPFNPETSIRYEISEAAQVVLVVYDVLGRRVRTLVDKWQPSGNHEIKWDGRGNDQVKVASGIYFYELRAGTEVTRKKMVFLQ